MLTSDKQSILKEVCQKEELKAKRCIKRRPTSRIYANLLPGYYKAATGCNAMDDDEKDGRDKSERERGEEGKGIGEGSSRKRLQTPQTR